MGLIEDVPEGIQLTMTDFGLIKEENPYFSPEEMERVL